MMLFGEREDDFPEIDLLDNHSKKTEDMSKFETIIGARNAVTGNIEGASPICINGKLIGDINSTSYVYISKTGSVEGNVTADHLVLLGNITGDSVNAGKLVVTATGVINSDVEVAKLTVEEGGVLNGQTTVTGSYTAPAEDEEEQCSAERPYYGSLPPGGELCFGRISPNEQDPGYRSIRGIFIYAVGAGTSGETPWGSFSGNTQSWRREVSSSSA